MKRLTIKQVAGANIRVNRKAYTSLFVGILVAVFLATATSLCAWGTIRGHEEQMAQLVGWMDMFMLGGRGVTDQQIRDTGYFREIGHVTVNATVADMSVCAGYYDETAEKLMNRRMEEGRMPEKAGEMAAERSALDFLNLEEVQVGDVLTLNMRPINGIAVEKTYTLVGILNEQNRYLENYGSNLEGMHFPALLVSPEDTYMFGGTVVHRVMTYAPLITLNQVIRHISGKLGYDNIICGVSRESGEAVTYDSGWDRARRNVNRITIWLVLGAALMLSACVGITSAMETLLNRKKEDIGMMRAIGATRRQIRKIYGSEAWLLAVTALPAGLLAGILAAWIVSRIAPDQVAFAPTLWLLVPVTGLSALCVFISSRMPLYRASRQMPMGMLRDTALLRRAGKLRNHKEFSPGRLIAGRRTRLHPLRRAGAACMVALTLSSTLLLGELVLGLYDRGERDDPAFQLMGGIRELGEEAFSQVISEDVVTRTDLRRIRSIPGVAQVKSITELRVNLLMDEVPAYFRSRKLQSGSTSEGIISMNLSTTGHRWGENDWLFYSEADLAEAAARRSYDDGNAESNVRSYAQRNLLRSVTGITENIIPVYMHIADLDTDALQAYVTDGTIDPDRLDSGEQVLVYAPAFCAKGQENGGFETDGWMNPQDIRDEDWDVVIRNDAFRAGMPLKLMEIAGKEEDADINYLIGGTDWRAYYQSAETVTAEVTVGAVLAGPVSVSQYNIYGFSLITSVKGAEALGLKLPGPEYTDVYLSGNPTEAEETEIESRISQISRRTQTYYDNNLRKNREYMAKKTGQLILFTGLILLFFAVSVFMQVSDATRQIRAEIKTIGTLRAVGADLETLVSCYRLPVWLCAAAAMIPCLLFYVVTEHDSLRLFTNNHPVIMIPVLAVMAAFVALACIAGIRGRLAAVSRQSIVENIREL